MTQGKIERYHRSMKSTIKPPKCILGRFKQAIGSFLGYIKQRYHETLDNLTPEDG
jgi:hypothetical protein